MKNKLRLGISTEYFKDQSLISRFQKIAKLGFRYVNIHIDKVYSDEEINAAYKAFTRLGLVCVQVTGALFPSSYRNDDDYTKAYNHIKILSAVQNIFQGRKIAISAGVYKNKRRKHHRAAVKFMRAACDVVQKKDQIITLDISLEKTSLLKSWIDMIDFYTKVDRDNFMVNVDTALLASLNVTDDALQFLENKIPLCHVSDRNNDDENIQTNIGEGSVDIRYWIKQIKPMIEETSGSINDCAVALIALQDIDEDEIVQTLKYLQDTIPKLHL